jgi:demethylmenaquinone methyltransferase/2-methoxy-6-polyprenyl-1,4-benzoquinol methylase
VWSVVHSIGDVGPFDRLAPLYDAFMPATDAGAIRAGLALAERPLVRGLDVAGGSGRASRALPEVEWTVVDAAPGMLRRARAAGVAGVRGDAARLPARTGSVDAVVVLDALHHVADRRAAVAEAARVLRPGGVLVVREFDPLTVRGHALVAAERLVGFDSAFWPPDRLADAVRDAGLAVSVPERGFTYTVAGVAPDGPGPQEG